MSINENLPRQLENALREIKDDDGFVDAMWRHAFILYHDLRNMELNNPPWEKHRQNVEEVERAMHQLINKLVKTGHDQELYRLMPQLQGTREKYAAAATALRARNGRITKNRTLEHLLKRVVEIYQAYDVPDRSIVGLISKHLPLFAPEQELDNLPSDTSIKRAKAAALQNDQ